MDNLVCPKTNKCLALGFSNSDVVGHRGKGKMENENEAMKIEIATTG